MDQILGQLTITVRELRGVQAEMQIWSCALSSYLKIFIGGAGLGSAAALSPVLTTHRWTGDASTQPEFHQTFSLPLKQSTLRKHLIFELWRTPALLSLIHI